MNYEVEKLDLSYKNLTKLPDLSLYKNLKNLNCSNNQISTLEGCPNSVINLDCSYNQLKNLEECPNSLIELDCSNNQIKILRDVQIQLLI